MDQVEIFSEKPIMSVLGLIKVGLGVFLLASVVADAGNGQNKLLMSAVAAFLIGAGLYDLSKVFDRRVHVRFWTEGFTSLDLGGVVVPWEALRQVEYIASGGSSAMVRFHLKADADLPIRFNPLALGGAFQLADGGARFVQIDVSPLRNGRARVLGAVARFAPDLPVVGAG